ncbi:DUF3703 domain-containing protein [Tahibacter amnicola]|uniref:DUF3703 domain-containing protein n=1 Tax=Tahibacter amnicola TaxID=2976241 RepID=A0ABY6BCF2_9GAMM|nr:DUF3703 domain-containing protein [Tahibacter amnicola]UXI66296.1 DUF3703 domain-containing protein [Tahibacter amnicola]
MPAGQRRKAAVAAELAAARQAIAQARHQDAFRHLERAHVLGQSRTGTHVASHWAMLQWAWRNRDLREGVGQVMRLIAAVLITRVWVPLGNTGGANVSAIRPMPVPVDLQALLVTFDD